MNQSLVKVSDLFDVKYGVNLELLRLDITKKRKGGGVCFVSRTEGNNGVSAFVERRHDIVPLPAGTLSVAGGGSVLATFLQPYEYYSGRDLYFLSPRQEMSERELLYYALCLRKNKYRYNYGRQANRTLRDLMIPAQVPEKFLQRKIAYPSAAPTLKRVSGSRRRTWHQGARRLLAPPS